MLTYRLYSTTSPAKTNWPSAVLICLCLTAFGSLMMEWTDAATGSVSASKKHHFEMSHPAPKCCGTSYNEDIEIQVSPCALKNLVPPHERGVFPFSQCHRRFSRGCYPCLQVLTHYPHRLPKSPEHRQERQRSTNAGLYLSFQIVPSLQAPRSRRRCLLWDEVVGSRSPHGKLGKTPRNTPALEDLSSTTAGDGSR